MEAYRNSLNGDDVAYLQRIDRAFQIGVDACASAAMAPDKPTKIPVINGVKAVSIRYEEDAGDGDQMYWFGVPVLSIGTITDGQVSGLDLCGSESESYVARLENELGNRTEQFRILSEQHRRFVDGYNVMARDLKTATKYNKWVTSGMIFFAIGMMLCVAIISKILYSI